MINTLKKEAIRKLEGSGLPLIEEYGILLLYYIDKAKAQEQKRIKKLLDEKIIGKGEDEMFDQGAYEENRQIYKAI